MLPMFGFRFFLRFSIISISHVYMSLVIFIKHQLRAFFRIFRGYLYTLKETMTKWCCVLFCIFRVYRLNIVIGIVLMVHHPVKPPLRQTLEAYPGLTAALSSTPSYQVLENTLATVDVDNHYRGPRYALQYIRLPSVCLSVLTCNSRTKYIRKFKFDENIAVARVIDSEVFFFQTNKGKNDQSS